MKKKKKMMVDFPLEKHRRLNVKTRKTIEDLENGIGVKTAKNARDLRKQLDK